MAKKNAGKFKDIDNVKIELDRMIHKSKIDQERIQEKVRTVSYIAVVALGVLLIFLYFYVTYKSLIADQRELKEAVDKVTLDVDKIEEEVGAISEDTTLIEFTNTSTEIQSICEDLPYDIPARQFEYDSRIRYESIELLKTCDNLVGKMMRVTSRYIEYNGIEFNLTAEDIESLSNDIEDLKVSLDSLDTININLLSEIFQDSQLIFLGIGVGIIIMVFDYRLKKKRLPKILS